MWVLVACLAWAPRDGPYKYMGFDAKLETGVEHTSTKQMCGPGPNVDLPTNLIYVKTYKTGSSSFGGVLRRIGCRHDFEDVNVDGVARLANTGRKIHSFLGQHISRAGLQDLLTCHGTCATKRPQAGWVSIVRAPGDRCLSAFYHHELGVRMQDTPDAKVKWLHREDCSHGQVRQLQAKPHATVAQTFHAYDFVAVLERFDESMLVMKHKYHLTLVDILYLRAKDSENSKRASRFAEHPPIEHEDLSVQHAHWALSSSPDAELHELANAALDREIRQIDALNGLGAFAADFAEYQEMLAVAEEHCRKHFWDSLLWADNGGGQQCLYDLSRQQGWETGAAQAQQRAERLAAHVRELAASMGTKLLQRPRLLRH